MALSGPVQAALRSQVQGAAKVNWYLALAPYGDPIFTGTVDDAGIAKSARTIGYLGADDTLIRSGMTLWVGSDVGLRDEGTVRIRGFVLEFNSGSTEFWYDEALTGAVSGDTGRVVSWVLTGGAWGDGDAEGVVYVDAITGHFQAAEDINGSVGGLNIASVVAAIDSLQVAENDDIAWTNGLHLTCPGEAGFYELWSILPRMTETAGVVTFYEDYDREYYDPYDDYLPPKANAGPPVCAFIGDGGYAEVAFLDNGSFSPEIGEGIAAVAWDFAGGTIHQGDVGMPGTCEIPNLIRYTTPGFRYVTLTVTDTTGAVRVNRMHVPVWIFDRETAPPLSVEVLSQEGRPNWTLRVKAFATDDSDTEPFYDFTDGALCVLFTEAEWPDGSHDIGGRCYRSNIRFVGWLDGESLTFDYGAGTCEFTALSHEAVMARLPGFAYTLEDSDAPAHWYEVNDLNMDRALHAHLERKSTVNQVCDVETMAEDNRTVAVQGFEDGSIYSQAQDHLLSDGMCSILSDRQGTLRVRRDPQMMDAIDRAAVETLLTIGRADWMNDVDQIKSKSEQLGLVRMGGFALETPLLSQAPGTAPSQQEASTYREGFIVEDQDELNLWCGGVWSKGNLEFAQVPVEMIGYWPVFDPADQLYVNVTTTDPLGRNDWDEKKFIVRGVTFRDLMGEGTARTELILEEASEIFYGETQVIPVAPAPTPPIYNPPPGPVPPPNWCGALSKVILRTSQGIFITENFDEPVAADVYWEASNSGLVADQRENMVDMAFDYDDGARLFVLVDTYDNTIAQNIKGALRCNDVFGGAPWSLQFDGDVPYDRLCKEGCDGECPVASTMCHVADGGTDDDTIGCWRALGCDPQTGHLLFIAGVTDPGAVGIGCHEFCICFYSADALNTLVCGDEFYHGGQRAEPWPNTRANGNISVSQSIGLFTFCRGWAAGSHRHRSLTYDGGVTLFNDPGEVWAWNETIWHTRADNIVYFYTDEGAQDTHISISADHGLTWADWDVLPDTPHDSGQALSLHFMDTNHLMFIDDHNIVYYSADAGFTWAGAAVGPDNAYCVVACADSAWPIPDGYGFIVGDRRPAAADNWVFLTRDMGLTWENRSGNLEDYLTHGADIIWQIIPIQEEC